MTPNSKRFAELASRVSADTWDLRVGGFDNRNYKRYFKALSNRGLRKRTRDLIRAGRFDSL